MNEWWEGLSAVNRGFYLAATAFGVLFVWQMIATLLGLAGDEMDGDADVSSDGTYDEFESGAESDAVESAIAFKLLSMRSILTFFTMFTWGTAFYMNNGDGLTRAMTLGVIWGTGGMVLIAFLLYSLKKLAETGTKDLNTCIGKTGTVYVNIPENGIGEVKVLVSKVSSHVKARGVDGKAIDANAAVKVIKRTEGNIFEVDLV